MAPRLFLAWGANATGQCCTGEEGAKVERRPRCVNVAVSRGISISTPIIKVASGEAHTLLLSGYGDIFACGRNKEGQLGLGTARLNDHCSWQPCIVHALRSWRITHISCGSQHSVAICSQGQAFEWGLLLPVDKRPDHEIWASKRHGLGRDFQEDLNERQRRIVATSWNMYLNNNAGILSDDGDDCAAIHALAGTECSRSPVHSPRRCLGLEGMKVTMTACGFAHSVVAVEDGSLLAAGYSEKGQLGHGSRVPSVRFGIVPLHQGLKSMACDSSVDTSPYLDCGIEHSAAVIAPEGQLFMWGLGVFGQLGLGRDKRERYFPERVPLPAPVIQVVCGDHHTMALTSVGDLFTFGHRDAVGGQSHYVTPDKRRELCSESGKRPERIFAGGTGCFAVVEPDDDDRLATLHSWGYNQRFQLGRYTAELQLLKPGEAALPRLAGAKIQSFSSGSCHCFAVLDASSCAVLPHETGTPFFGSTPLLTALAGDVAPYDVLVIGGSCPDELLGAHRSILLARCPALGSRITCACSVAATRPWQLDFNGHSALCVAALLEYLYTDYCRVRADIAAELRTLAEELGLARLATGAAVASETSSMEKGFRWVRTPAGQWKQVEVRTPDVDIATKSTYSVDLESLVVEDASANDFAYGNIEEHDDYVKLELRQAEDSGTSGTVAESSHQHIYVARALLLTIDFFRAFLEGGFATAHHLTVDSIAAFVLCLRMLATGNFSIMPQEPAGALAVLREAHQLQLPDVVAAAEWTLVRAVEDGKVDAAERECMSVAAALYDLPKIVASHPGDGDLC